MAVHDRSYRPYTGELTRVSTRFLVLPRYSIREIFQSRLFTSFFTGCFAYPAGCALLIYIQHNLELAESLPFDLPPLLAIDATFFHIYLWIQTILAFFLTVVVGPALLSPDLVNGALPLYLSHPLTRRDYLLGKVLILVALLSTLTWIPGLGLYLLEGGLRGSDGWIWQHLRLPMAILAGSWAAIVALCLPALAVSAHHKSKGRARASFILLIFIASAAGNIINEALKTDWGGMLVGTDVLDVIYAALLGATSEIDLPLGGALASLAAICTLSLAVIVRRLRAFEVVK